MSVSVMNLVWQKAPYQGNTFLTLLSLADRSDDEGVSWPGVLTIAKKTRQSERNTQVCLDRLRQDGYVTSTERDGTSNVYRIHLKKLEKLPDYIPPKSKRGGDRTGGAKFAPVQSPTQGVQTGAQEGCKEPATFAPNTSDTSVDSSLNTDNIDKLKNGDTEGWLVALKKRLIKIAYEKFGNCEPEGHPIWNTVKQKYGHLKEGDVAMQFLDWAGDGGYLDAPVSTWAKSNSPRAVVDHEVSTGKAVAKENAKKFNIAVTVDITAGKVTFTDKQLKNMLPVFEKYDLALCVSAAKRYWDDLEDKKSENYMASQFSSESFFEAKVLLETKKLEEKKQRELDMQRLEEITQKAREEDARKEAERKAMLEEPIEF